MPPEVDLRLLHGRFKAMTGCPKMRSRLFSNKWAADCRVNGSVNPHEIAEAVLLLIGNGFITGAVLDVDGGARLT